MDNNYIRMRFKLGEHETYTTLATLARALSSSIPHQPKGKWLYLCFQYYSRCGNPLSPVTQFTLFLFLPPIP